MTLGDRRGLISVVIVNFMRYDHLQERLRQLSLSEWSDVEILVVENTPSQFREPIIFPDNLHGRVVDLGYNAGFGRGCNAGMQESKGEYICLLNSDAEMPPNGLGQLADFINASGADVVAPVILDLSGNEVKNQYPPLDQTWFLSLLRIVGMNPVVSRIKTLLGSRFRSSGTVSRVGGFYGSCLFFKRSLFDETGGFDPDFFMYSEDIEWFRNRLRGRSFRVCDSVRVVHEQGASDVHGLMSEQAVLSYYLYYYKLGRGRFWLYVIGNSVNIITGMLVSPLASRSEQERMRAVFWMTLNIFRDVFFDLLKWDNSFGARPAPLMTRSVKRKIEEYAAET